jgi:hypothetical protein
MADAAAMLRGRVMRTSLVLTVIGDDMMVDLSWRGDEQAGNAADSGAVVPRD